MNGANPEDLKRRTVVRYAREGIPKDTVSITHTSFHSLESLGLGFIRLTDVRRKSNPDASVWISSWPREKGLLPRGVGTPEERLRAEKLLQEREAVRSLFAGIPTWATVRTSIAGKDNPFSLSAVLTYIPYSRRRKIAKRILDGGMEIRPATMTDYAIDRLTRKGRAASRRRQSQVNPLVQMALAEMRKDAERFNKDRMYAVRSRAAICRKLKLDPSILSRHLGRLTEKAKEMKRRRSGEADGI